MSESKPIYQKYSGNIKSDKLTIFQIGTTYRFIYQTFLRTNPCQAQRKLGKKPKRNLVTEQIFDFTDLSRIDFSIYPFKHLIADFNPKALQ